MSAPRAIAKGIFAAADRLLEAAIGPRILIYHQVGVGLGRQMEVLTEDFLWQLDWLVEHHRVVDLDTALGRLGDPSANDLVVITFDDGYRDTFETAYPALLARELPFTLYLATEHLETRTGLGGADSLSWTQIERMLASDLATIGSHTHRHADLRHATVGEIEEELGLSDAILADRLGVTPRHFAYPWGYWSDRADGLVRSRYSSAALGAAGNTSRRVDPYLLHRRPVQLSDGRRWFRQRMAGGLMFEERARRRLRGYRGP